MLASPYSDMAEWNAADPWCGEWDASQSWGTSRTSPWPSQPTQADIDRVQLHIHQLQLWKYQAEATLHGAGGYESLAWQAGFEGESATSSPLQIPSWQRVGEEEALASEPSAPGKSSRTTTSPTTSAGASPLASTRTSLSSLPLPMRLPIGPEPMLAPSSAKTSLTGSELQDPSILRGLCSLNPLGLTLSRTASIPLSADDEDSKEPRLQLPPGLLDDEEDEADVMPSGGQASKLDGPLAVVSSSSSLCPSPTSSAEVSPGIRVGPIDVLGVVCARAEWRIDDLRGKLQASMGRPLVSPPFAVRGLPNLRLMVFPDAREAVKGVRSRERKGLYAAMVKKGPLHGSLKLKADCLEHATVLLFNLTVGSVRRGPFSYDFSECAIHGCEDFATDWLKQVEEPSGNLRVGVEILDVKEYTPGSDEVPVLGTTSTRMYSPDPVEPGMVTETATIQSVGRGRGRRARKPRG
mmetsp:Transcript_30735/g.55758  ORF Transcript_30735/g.55758 Transcript_30735/m.55758 type:complete len:465 (+) Transcript_30735:74-1468(+)